MPDPNKIRENNLLSANENQVDGWQGKWFPKKPGYQDTNLVTVPLRRVDTGSDSNGRIPMGVVNPNCDDAKTNLTVDFDPFNVTHQEYYLCMDRRPLYQPNYETGAIMTTYRIPAGYVAPHHCMFDNIEYAEAIPSL